MIDIPPQQNYPLLSVTSGLLSNAFNDEFTSNDTDDSEKFDQNDAALLDVPRDWRDVLMVGHCV